MEGTMSQVDWHHHLAALALSSVCFVTRLLPFGGVERIQHGGLICPFNVLINVMLLPFSPPLSLHFRPTRSSLCQPARGTTCQQHHVPLSPSSWNQLSPLLFPLLYQPPHHPAACPPPARLFRHPRSLPPCMVAEEEERSSSSCSRRGIRIRKWRESDARRVLLRLASGRIRLRGACAPSWKQPSGPVGRREAASWRSR